MKPSFVYLFSAEFFLALLISYFNGYIYFKFLLFITDSVCFVDGEWDFKCGYYGILIRVFK